MLCTWLMFHHRNAMQELGLMSMSSVLNVHCKHSFGFRMVEPSGKTFVFSGDTEKCENVINAAKEADILVHEATFESDMIADAKFKKHSTIEDALAVRSTALTASTVYQSILWLCDRENPCVKKPVHTVVAGANICLVLAGVGSRHHFEAPCR
jgi:hypothetical protein